jgi:integrase
MKVTLRKKKIGKGQVSLYLDFYPAILHPDTGKFTRREFLSIYIHGRPKTELEKKHNRETLELAENMRAMRQIETQNKQYGFLSAAKREGSFMMYFKKEAAKKTGTNIHNWRLGCEYFEKFAGPDIRFIDITAQLCEDFKEYLLHTRAKKRKTVIERNTAVNYYAKFRAMLKLAYRDKLLTENLYEQVRPIKEKETHVAALEIEELQALADTECEDPLFKNAALFSGLTGLRFSDVDTLRWSEVKGRDGNYFIQFRQEKTDGAETMPIPDQAFDLMGERRDDTEKVFPGLLYSRVPGLMERWGKAAGLGRRVRFHDLRDTYATLQLTNGTDIYTISKMLGHKHVKTTQRYTKVVDQKKKQATEKIKLDMKIIPITKAS